MIKIEITHNLLYYLKDYKILKYVKLDKYVVLSPINIKSIQKPKIQKSMLITSYFSNVIPFLRH